MEDISYKRLFCKSRLPFHQASLAPDEAWGSAKSTRCACGRKVALWAKKCLYCRKPNQFRRLLKKRKRIEQWIDDKVQRQLNTKIIENQILLKKVKRYASVLSEIVENPFPQRRKKESHDKFLQRVAGFFPSMFKLTSPKKMACEIPALVRRTSAGMIGSYWIEHRKIFAPIINSQEAPEAPLFKQSQKHQLERICIDMMNLCVPYAKALRTLQLSHSRMVAAWEPVKRILERDNPKSLSKTLWNKARSLATPGFSVICLQTSIWNNSQEKEELKKFDHRLAKFLEHCKWFQEQTDKLIENNRHLQNIYKLSMRRHLVISLVKSAQDADPHERHIMTKRVLSQKGVSSFFWRWLVGE